MPKNTVKQLAANRGKAFLERSNELGPLVSELQKYAENAVFSKSRHMSFETGEQGTVKIYFPQAATVNKIRVQVVKALAGTDAGTLAVADAGSNSLGTSISLAASSALGTEGTLTPTANNQIAEDGFITLTTAKTTAGGKISIDIEYSPWINY